MSAIKTSCRFCTLALTPFICQSGAHCFGQHPDHNGKVYWYFWPLGQGLKGQLLPPMPSQPLGSQVRPAATVSSKGTLGALQFSSINRNRQACGRSGVPPPVIHPILLHDPPTEPLNHNAAPPKFAIDPTLLHYMSTECQAGPSSSGNRHTEDNCDGAVQFARDMESACQLSLQDVETEWNPRPSFLLHPHHLFNSSSSPLSSPCATPDMQLLLITTGHKSKAEYKISAIQVSTKAKLDQECLTAQLASQCCIDLVYWDQNDHLPNNLVLQWTYDNQSDIPHWPDFTLTHVTTLLLALGEDVMAVKWFNPKILV
ncbi:hypothetical protein PAXRUDRAFT_28159 [Paxillus rubicundulus Ve08.2h10]|uniref:C3H1-type domain-containing protein n=1 Tax=Paxillus rubicundulus Ve08.2h10 TaxID=930991 RepID=A0A0D0CY17_9AGAM|nr:hypothetical protein PAXRUDRAFT_28159 [Paxillus rubicundulus Ve08.2h10]